MGPMENVGPRWDSSTDTHCNEIVISAPQKQILFLFGFEPNDRATHQLMSSFLLLEGQNQDNSLEKAACCDFSANVCFVEVVENLLPARKKL